jgi:hypothetical protein
MHFLEQLLGQNCCSKLPDVDAKGVRLRSDSGIVQEYPAGIVV